MRLPENGTVDVTARLALARARRVAARVADPDGLPADDVMWLVRPKPQRERGIVVVSPGSGQQDGIYAQRALQALDGARTMDVAVSLRIG